jgi:hypothetical protein
MLVSEVTKMELPRIVIGQPVRGHDLWDREREIEEIWKALETSSVLLSAPRRFGKTSIMLALADHPRENWQAHYLDVEWIKGPEDFVAEIMATLLGESKSRKLLEGVKRVAGDAIKLIEEVGLAEFKIGLRESLERDWQDKGKALIKLLKEVEQRTILIVDELPLLVSKIARQRDDGQAEDFLFWLRGLRHIPDLQDKVRWVIGGSIGMEKVLQRVGAGTKTVNDLYTLRVQEFSAEAAEDFLKALLEKEAGIKKLPSQLLGEFLLVAGVPIPYFLQILVRESLNEMERRREKSLSEKIIEQAYRDGVLACYNRTYFEHYHERIDGYYGPELAEVARRFLSALAKQGRLSRKEFWDIYMQETEGKGQEENFSYLLSDLENDFYIVLDPKNERYTFATKVLRDWWLRYHAV